MRTSRLLRVLAFVMLGSGGAAAAGPEKLAWIFGFDFERDADVARVERILSRGADHGLTGAVLNGGLDALDRRSDAWQKGLDRVLTVCAKRHLEVIPAVFSFGYGEPFLSINPHLAEGLPVRDALFVAGADGRARLVADPPVAIAGGDFEDHLGDHFPAFDSTEDVGRISFADTSVVHGGKASIRLEHFTINKHGHGRVFEKIAVHPWRCYRMTLWVKTDGLSPKGSFQFLALAPRAEETDLLHRNFDLPATTDWRKLTAVFNSLENDSVTLAVGVWGGQAGRLWLDDWSIEELGPMNVLRRPGTPVTVQADGGGTLFVEGRDYAPLVDPAFRLWSQDHAAPDLTLLPGGRIAPGTRLRVSWYHPIVIHRSQVGVCLSEPEVYAIAAAEARRLIDRLHPRRVFLDMDEIRMGGTCAADGDKAGGALLGDAVSRIVSILRAASPGLEVMLWADMFDPNHNAVADYFWWKGDLAGSWRHVPADLIMVPWGDQPEDRTLKFFADNGFRVIGGCYYDADDLEGVKAWRAATEGQPNVLGLLYTPWSGKYDLLNGFCDLLSR